MLPVLLVIGALAAAAGAFTLDDAPVAEATGSSSPETPLLSARRTPELLTAPLAERRLVPQLEFWIQRSPADSCLVVESAGSVLFDHRPTEVLPAGSTQKIVTGAAALLAYGPDARLETRAVASGPVSDGVLDGDLYIVGGGDPLLSTNGYRNQVMRGADRLRDVGDIADAVAEAGITRIEGGVIGDESRYDADRFHPAWPERFRSQNQAGPVSALNVDDGFADFPSQPSGLEAKVPSDDPAANAATAIVDALEARGITVSGSASAGVAPEDAEPIAVVESAPLDEIVAQMLIDSDNDTAEMMVKEMGLTAGGEGTWEAGTTAVADELEEAGVLTDGVAIVDGSGLSDENRLSCQLVVDLLTWPEIGPLLVQGLAVAGENGTLRERFAGTEVAGRMRGKTGTLRNVNALSGHVTPDEEVGLTFAYVAHVPDPQELTLDQINVVNDLGQILVDHSAGVDLELLLPVGYPEDEPDAEQADEAENSDQ